MQTKQDIFNAMKADIEAAAKVQIDAINAETAAIEEETMAALREEAKHEAELRLKQELEEIHSEAASEISELHTERTRKLIDKRDQLVADVFKEARAKLVEFTESSEYKAWLAQKAKEAAAYNFTNAVIKLRQADMSLADDVKNAYGQACDIEASDDIVIGGLIVEDQNSAMVVNETLEFALAGQKDWFNKNSGLVLD